jgi:hypothetical protein
MFYKELWPLTQSFELVNGNTKDVSKAIFKEILRYTKNEDGIILNKNNLINISDIFLNNVFTNYPTKILILPTITEWVIIWSNSFVCDGFDTLCYNLTNLYKFDTLHFNSHDTATTLLPGTVFHYRYYKNDEIKERYVQTCVNDYGKWEFFQKGEKCNFEDDSYYKNRYIKNKLNEKIIRMIFNNIGVNPWDEKTYKYKDIYYEIVRTKYPDTIKKIEINNILITK